MSVDINFCYTWIYIENDRMLFIVNLGWDSALLLLIFWFSEGFCPNITPYKSQLRLIQYNIISINIFTTDLSKLPICNYCKKNYRAVCRSTKKGQLQDNWKRSMCFAVQISSWNHCTARTNLLDFKQSFISLLLLQFCPVLLTFQNLAVICLYWPFRHLLWFVFVTFQTPV